MSDQNPYQTPESTVEVADDSEYQPSFFAASGRIGRLRYLAYGTGLNLLVYAVMFAVMGSAAVTGSPEAFAGIGGVVAFLLYLMLFVFSVIFVKRRLNDLDKSGWFFLLFFIPVVNLIMLIYLVFFRGSEGSNRFGPRPTKNPIGVKILGLLLPILFIFGILAAIAIPAYQGYVERAGMLQQQTEQGGESTEAGEPKYLEN